MHDADTGAVVLVYIAPIEESTIVLLDKLRHMEITPKSRMKKVRGKKVVTPWDVFAYRPRNEYRQHYNCAPADLATEHPDADLVLKAFGKVVTRCTPTTPSA